MALARKVREKMTDFFITPSYAVMDGRLACRSLRRRGPRKSSRPLQYIGGRPAIDDAIGGDACKPCVGDRVVGHPELIRGVRVAVQRKDTPRFLRGHGHPKV